jgi:hypothetical protein
MLHKIRAGVGLKVKALSASPSMTKQTNKTKEWVFRIGSMARVGGTWIVVMAWKSVPQMSMY